MGAWHATTSHGVTFRSTAARSALRKSCCGAKGNTQALKGPLRSQCGLSTRTLPLEWKKKRRTKKNTLVTVLCEGDVARGGWVGLAFMQRDQIERGGNRETPPSHIDQRRNTNPGALHWGYWTSYSQGKGGTTHLTNKTWHPASGHD